MKAGSVEPCTIIEIIDFVRRLDSYLATVVARKVRMGELIRELEESWISPEAIVSTVIAETESEGYEADLVRRIVLHLLPGSELREE